MENSREALIGRQIARRSFVAGATAAGASSLLGYPAGRMARAAEGKSLEVMIVQSHAGAGDLLKKAFKEQTGVDINLTVVPYDQVQQQATLDVQSGKNQFDVIDYWYISIGALAADGVVLDITDRIAKDAAVIKPDDFIQTYYDVYTLVDRKRYGLPYDGDTHVLFYNREIFDRHGLSAPKTWDDYFNTAKAITEAEKANGIYGAVMMGFKAPIIIGCTYVNRLAGFGGQLLVDGKPNLLSDEAVGAAAEMQRVAPYCLPTPGEVAFEHALPAFLSGKGGMIEFWTDLGVYAQDPKGSKIVDKWEVVQLPVGGKATKPKAALEAGFGWAVSQGSTKPDLAFDFIRWATLPETCEMLITATGSGIDPIRTSNLYSDKYKEFAPKVQNAIVGAVGDALAWPTSPDAPKLMTVLSDELAAVLAGQKDAKQAMADAQAQWERIIG